MGLYKVGDKVVYPHHGAGTVVKKEKRKVLGEERDELEAKIRWLEDLIKEGERFLPFHENGEIGLEGLKESLKREKKVLADLIKAMDSAREGREEKKLNVSWFEPMDSSSE